MNFGQMSKCLCSLQARVTELELNGGGGGGSAAINFEGEWTSLGDAFAYEVGDVVIYDVPADGFGANTYYCVTAHSSNIAVTPDIDASWVMIASGGADGADGPAGSPGDSLQAFQTLTDGATITWTAASVFENNAVVTIAGNRTIAMSGWTSGMKGVLRVIQDGAGGRSITLPATSKVADGGAGIVTLSTAPNAEDILYVICIGTNLYRWTHIANFT